MSSLVVGPNDVVRPAAARRATLHRALLGCGILYSLTYLAADVAGALRWEGYSYTAQTISELSAIGAPSRPLVVPVFLAAAVLAIAFGLGVWPAAGRKRALRVAAGLLVGFGAFCLTGPFTPMHQRGTEQTLTDTLHVAAASVDVLFIVLIIGSGANAFGRNFRLYSIATMAAVLGFGAVAGMDGPRVAANLPTPWVGVMERVCVFSWLLWVATLAIGLLRAEGGPGQIVGSDGIPAQG